jgi:5-methylcytosine-specific restriction endonuclease McrA
MRARARLNQRRAHEEYQNYRQPMQAKWRPLILERDKKCRVCGDQGKDEPLHMAHITDARYFVKLAKNKEAVTFSYRWDNLYMLCARCHRISHKFRPSPDELPRREEVENMEESLRKLRGWSTAAAALPPGLVPERMRPRKSFHDNMRITPLVPFPTFAKYAGDGGIVFRDEEAPPLQSQLIVENEEKGSESFAVGGH